MSQFGGKSKIPNRLWRARKRRGLGQKQIAFLIGKSAGQVSRYERGVRLPELQTIFAIELAYGTPLRILYKEIYDLALKNMRRRLKKKAGSATASADLLGGTGTEIKLYCAYEDVLKGTALFSEARAPVRDHVTRLAKKLAGL